MRILILVVMCTLCTRAIGQVQPCQKIGFADVQLIAHQLPETRQMEAELSSLGGQLQNQLNAKYSLYNQKVKEIENPSLSSDEMLVQKRHGELLKLEEEIRKFASDAEVSFRKKQEQLMRPILLKIDRSIREVATENDYSIIINSAVPGNQNTLLYGAKECDISDLVLKKMGITINQQRR